jgi:hypothetical protein
LALYNVEREKELEKKNKQNHQDDKFRSKTVTVQVYQSEMKIKHHCKLKE